MDKNKNCSVFNMKLDKTITKKIELFVEIVIIKRKEKTI